MCFCTSHAPPTQGRLQISTWSIASNLLCVPAPCGLFPRLHRVSSLWFLCPDSSGRCFSTLGLRLSHKPTPSNHAIITSVSTYLIVCSCIEC